MARNKRKRKNNRDYRGEWEDYQDIRKSGRKSNKSSRKRDKKYLSDVLKGDIDTESYHDYNDIQ